MYEVDWSLVVEFLKAGPPTIIAGIVGWIAYQQWRTAKDKLALDLFDRRFAAHRALTESIRAWSNEPYRVAEQVVFRPPSPHSTQLNRDIAEARFLFGEDVRQDLAEIVRLLNALESAKDALHLHRSEDDNDRAGAAKARAMLLAYDNLSKAVERFDHDVERYMMLDKISVGKPKDRQSSEEKPNLATILEQVEAKEAAEEKDAI